MIQRLRIRNYRSLADVDVSLEPITVLVGPNGSGKSNFVDALRFVSDALTEGVDAAVRTRGGFSVIRRATRVLAPVVFDVTLTLGGQPARYGFTLTGDRSDVRVSSERFDIEGHEGGLASYAIRNGKWEKAPYDLSGLPHETVLMLPLLPRYPAYQELWQTLTNVSFYGIFSRALAEPQRRLSAYPLEDKAGNLGSVLLGLEPGRKTALMQALHWATGDVVDVEVKEAGDYLVTSLRHRWENDRGKRTSFPLSQESDGTLRLLALLTALVQQPPRTLLAIEEPELTVHPGALAVLWEKMVDASVWSQVLVTTHSPDLLDFCSAEQLRIVEKVNGDTRIGPVVDEQKQMIRKRLVAPGQLLQAEGLRRAEAE